MAPMPKYTMPIPTRNPANRPTSGPLNTYSAIPIVSRQRLVRIQAAAVSILIVRQSVNFRYALEDQLKLCGVKSSLNIAIRQATTPPNASREIREQQGQNLQQRRPKQL